ncbi:Mss4-like protein [Aspergillus avenaceus]|uniref:Mss4-like protein n=1 Tax=Aspergillus avenaceus TaxID=36643 RepID=A0A5N6U1Q3_ASPAV|nr:Mss4-like protein [Aspergillus avenaceus]
MAERTCITCLCGASTQEVLLEPSIESPVLNLCHCTACRAVTGQLYSSYYPLQTPPSLDNLREYQQSTSICRYFCRTCGAHVFARFKHERYFVAAGLLTEPPQTRSVKHWRVNDSRDGGLASFLQGEQETASECWLEAVSESLQPSWEETPVLEQSHKLQARCHCGGIKFYITSPDATSREPHSPWPDLLVPYHSGSSSNPEDVKWWLRDENSRYLAGTCTCTSCRLASGFPIQTWAFIPRSNIVDSGGLPLEFNSATMQQYESSPQVYREFCNRCGATVFWHCQERPLLIDISIGLLQANSGSKAEEWLAWHTGRVSFEELALDRELVHRLGTGLKALQQNR